MQERERVERRRAIEHERARIARDLHDELGSNLTEIRMLAMTALELQEDGKETKDRLELIAQKTAAIIATLDELVWAVNPKNDTIASLAEYLASVVEEYFSITSIVCDVEMPNAYPDMSVASETRHHVVRSVKEALNNSVKHGHPTRVRFSLTLLSEGYIIVVQDNGVGFDVNKPSAGNGLANLKERMRQLNGRCSIESTTGSGTRITFSLPYKQPSLGQSD